MLPAVTDKVTPGEPVNLPPSWFVVNMNLYTAESLSLRSEILRVQSLLLELYCTRPEYSETVIRSTGSLLFFLVNHNVFSTLV